jgi:hypothetical protein
MTDLAAVRADVLIRQTDLGVRLVSRFRSGKSQKELSAAVSNLRIKV